MPISNQALNTQTSKTPAERGVTEGRAELGTFQRGKYSVDNLTYPLDLFRETGASTGPGQVAYDQTFANYVVFYISVSESSKVVKQGGGNVLGPVDRSEQNRIGAQGSVAGFGTTATQAGAIVGGLVGAANAVAGGISTGSGGLRSRLGSALGSFAGNVGQGILAGAGTNYIATELALKAQQELFDTNIQQARTFRRLKNAIALNVPQNMVVGYRVNYADEELGLLYGNAAAANSEGLSATQVAAAALIGRSPAAGALSAVTKTALNPRKEQLFKSVDFRRFTFDYQFAPRSQAETDAVRSIINMFKYHMHPEYLDQVGRLAYLFPSEFDIVYYYGSNEHPYLAKVSTCVLAEMTVNYSPNGQFSTHDDGSPTQINVQLTFVELENLTKERFGSGEEGAQGIRRATF
jgi:hypothetical protein